MRTILSNSDVVSVEPTVEPVSVLEATREADYDDGDRDGDFRNWIIQARKKVEHDARVALINQTRIKRMDAFPSESFITLRKPLSSITSVQYIDSAGTTQTWDSSNYTVDTSRDCFHLAYSVSWPDIRGDANSVIITYISGYGAAASNVPEAARWAILMLVRHWYENPGIVLTGSISKELEITYREAIHELRGGVYP